MSLKRFVLLFSALVLAAGVFAWWFESKDMADTVLIPKFWVVFGFLAILTLIAFIVSVLGVKNGGANSVYIIMGAIVIKLLFSMALVAVYLLKFKVNSVFFAIQFFSLYFVFTSFEVYALLCNLRHQNKT